MWIYKEYYIKIKNFLISFDDNLYYRAYLIYLYNISYLCNRRNTFFYKKNVPSDFLIRTVQR